MYKLFLDDVRVPLDCTGYMHRRIGSRNPIYLEHWHIVKSYQEFVDMIEKDGLPQVVSFDNDLADEHYNFEEPEEGYKEKTGYECLKWLIDYCIDNKKEVPDCIFHTGNEVAHENMVKYLENYKKHLKASIIE